MPMNTVSVLQPPDFTIVFAEYRESEPDEPGNVCRPCFTAIVAQQQWQNPPIIVLERLIPFHIIY